MVSGRQQPQFLTRGSRCNEVTTIHVDKAPHMPGARGRDPHTEASAKVIAMSGKKADDISQLKQAENEAADIVRAAREGKHPDARSGVAWNC